VAFPTAWPDLYPVFPALLLLALVLPFEVIRPIVGTPWLSLTDEKIVFLLLAAAWLLQGQRAIPTRAELRSLVPSIVLTLVALASAVLALDYVDDALRVVWRFGVVTFAALVALRVANGGRLQPLLWAIVVGAGLSALFGLAEASGWSALDPVFGLFKVAPTRIGAAIRISGSFQYATIASMYFEMVTPLALFLAGSARTRWLRVLAAGIAVLCVVNVALSLTRAGMLTVALVLLVALSNRRMRWPALTALAALLAMVAVLFRTTPAFDMRLSTESDADWYGAAYAAPASLTLAPGQVASIDLDVRNEGRIVWSSQDRRHPFALAYRWLSADGSGVLDIAPGEVSLPRDVQPGETVRLSATVPVPALPAGTYRLDWGMLQRDVVQFYERGWANAQTTVNVPALPVNASAPPPGVTPRDDEEAPWVVGRLDLWTAGWRLALARPLLGYGPDNFRHFYGTQLNLESWDERVQANDVYLELLVDVGIVGLVAFLWQVVPILRRTLLGSGTALALGLALLAFLVHGLLDSFLTFTPTAVLFWLVLGVGAATAQKPHVSGR
jgi:hypothetical protein